MHANNAECQLYAPASAEATGSQLHKCHDSGASLLAMEFLAGPSAGGVYRASGRKTCLAAGAFKAVRGRAPHRHIITHRNSRWHTHTAFENRCSHKRSSCHNTGNHPPVSRQRPATMSSPSSVPSSSLQPRWAASAFALLRRWAAPPPHLSEVHALPGALLQGVRWRAELSKETPTSMCRGAAQPGGALAQSSSQWTGQRVGPVAAACVRVGGEYNKNAQVRLEVKLTWSVVHIKCPSRPVSDGMLGWYHTTKRF